MNSTSLVILTNKKNKQKYILRRFSFKTHLLLIPDWIISIRHKRNINLKQLKKKSLHYFFTIYREYIGNNNRIIQKL